MIDLIKTEPQVILQNKQKHQDLYAGKREFAIQPWWEEGICWHTQEAQMNDQEKAFESTLSKYNVHMEAALEGFDNVPVCSFFDAVAYLMGSAYGCPVVCKNGVVSALPAYQDGEALASFQKKEKIYGYGLYEIIFAYLERFQERYPGLDITVSDTQSPMDVFNVLLPVEEAMLTLYDDDQLARRVMEAITDSIIEVNEEFRKRIKCFAGFKSDRYFPAGIFVSNDDAAYLSPDLYKEFASPCDDRLGRYFGGIGFHVCMGYEQNLKNLASTEYFTEFDAMPYYNDPQKILNAIGTQGRKVWRLYNYGWTVPQERNENDLQFFQRILDQARGICGVTIELSCPKKAESLRLADQVREYAAKTGWKL